MVRYIVLLLLVAGVCAKKRYDGHRLVSVFANGKSEAAVLHSLEDDYSYEGLDFWTEPSPVLPTDIRVSPNDFEKLRQVLTEVGIQFNVTNDNVQIDIEIEEEEQWRARARNTGEFCNIYDTYCTFTQIEDLLANWQEQNPSRMQTYNFGTTYLDRSLMEIRVVESDLMVIKPAIYIEAGTHAREWISVSSALTLIDKLLTKYPGTEEMLQKYDWYIVPVHNPDGYDYTFTNERYWRKNRQPCYGIGQGTGIDLNRNWNSNFGGVGTSNRCDSDVFRGQYAFEALETMRMNDAFKTLDTVTEVVAFFSVHCYSQMMLVPYAYTSTKPADYNNLKNVADSMMEALRQVDGRQFTVGTPPDILSAAAGGAYDYFYDSGVEYSYTYELRPGPGQGLAGFALPSSQIGVATDEFFASLKQFASLTL